MLRGSFGAHSGEPNLDAYLVLPQLGVSGQVSFLVDTGAAITCLHPNDLLALGADLEAVRGLPTLPVSGVGGSPNVYRTPGYLAFGDDDSVYVYEIPVSILDPQDAPPLASMLGRGILRHWRMTYDQTNDVLEFAVNYADQTMALPGS
jgi:hypothetical protein